MATHHQPSRTRSTSPASGLLAGALLRCVREQAGHSRETLAERLSVSADTLQSWETGRRPLVNLSHVNLAGYRRKLHQAGADPQLLGMWDQALTADSLVEGFTVDPGEHSLAQVVPTRTVSELLAWLLSGQAPRQLNGHAPPLHVPAGTRHELGEGLWHAADAADGTETGMMLRRQALFFTAADPSSPTERPLREQWTPEWPVARSAAVSATMVGNHEPMRRFVDTGLATDEGMSANLTYWAYWVGEIPGQWVADSDMLTDDYPYSGHVLLDSLTTSLTTAPYRELCAHSIWALLKQRPHLVHHQQLRDKTVAAVHAATFDDDLFTPLARRRLDQVAYRIGAE